MQNQSASPSHWLEAEYLQRRQKNPSYSLRAFSRLLGLPSGRVSQLLSRKRNLTPGMGKRIAQKLGYDPKRTHDFLASIDAAKRARREPAGLPAPSGEYAPLDMDHFQSIADPLHYSILSLLETKGFKGSLRELHVRLGTDPVTARAAVDRLARLGLVRTDARGALRLARSPGLTTTHDVQSSALRVAHRKVLEESLAALEEIAVELRDVTSMTMAVDPARLGEAKEKIRAFRRSLSEFLESGAQTEVYRLNIQLVPVTKRKDS